MNPLFCGKECHDDHIALHLLEQATVDFGQGNCICGCNEDVKLSQGRSKAGKDGHNNGSRQEQGDWGNGRRWRQGSIIVVILMICLELIVVVFVDIHLVVFIISILIV